MADILTFIPQIGLEAAENVQGFIEGCRVGYHTFGNDLDFASNQWDVSAFVHKRGKSGRVAFTFSSFDSCRSRTKWVPMTEPFLSFAKAKMRYDFGRRPKEQHSQKMAALRAIEKALVESAIDGIPRVENVDPHVLNLAASCLKKENPGSAYQSGCHLEGIARWLVENQMTRTPFQWRNIIKKPDDLLSKISPEADEYRLRNIPSKAALSAIPQIYHNATDPRDILISSMTALMFSFLGRFNEFFALSVGCEYEDRRPDGSEIYGLRWHTSKRAEPKISYPLKTMAGICRDAIGRLRKVTEEARQMADWYEKHPEKIYLPRELEYLRDEEYIRAADLALLVGQKDGSKACRWAGEHGIEWIKVRPRRGVGAPGKAFRLEEVERVVCGMLPEGFPVYDSKAGLIYRNALLLVPLNFFHEKRGNWRCMFQVVDIDSFNNQIGSGAKHGKGSMFSRNNFVEEDGAPIEVDSHDFRHYLSYLAKSKGVDNLVLALWAGRKRVADNRHYGDPTVAEKSQMLREATPDVVESLSLVGLDVNDPECSLMFENERAILEIQYQYIHETRFGYCVHKYDVTPCERRMQCLECTDHLCIKGQKAKAVRIREELEGARRTLGSVERAIVDGGHVSGSKLHAYSKRRVGLLEQLIGVLENPEIPAGSKIQFNANAADSPDQIAVRGRAAIEDREGKLLAATVRAALAEEPKVPTLPS